MACEWECSVLYDVQTEHMWKINEQIDEMAPVTLIIWKKMYERVLMIVNVYHLVSLLVKQPSKHEQLWILDHKLSQSATEINRNGNG